MSKNTIWSVLVVYEDPARREAAVQFCDEIVRQFWAQDTIDVNWCSFHELGKPEKAAMAAAQATTANLLVFAPQSEGELPPEIRSWMESWLGTRGEHEGALVGLGDPSGFGGAPGPKFTWLRQAAHKAGMDYLTKAPSEMTLAFPELPESYTERAAVKSSVLDDILGRSMAPPSRPR